MEQKNFIKRFIESSWLMPVLVALVILVIAGTVFYYKVVVSSVYIESSKVEAPSISLAPQNKGVLEELYVKAGDTVAANTPVARVGDELITTKVAGLIITVQNNIGTLFNPGQAVVTEIDPTQLRVVGTLQEDKGLADIKVGQPAVFTVDTFGSQKFTGIVDEISPTAHAGDVVFNISDQREVSQYDVKVRFDVAAYPEIKNGMSAKIWVYKH